MNLRERLKQSTKEPHSRLDAAIRNLDPFKSQENYQVYLQLMLELHLRCQDSLAYVEKRAKLDSHQCSLADLIADDLNTLGQVTDLNSVQLGANPVIENSCLGNTVAAKTEAKMWAESYVMEGSAMGGMLMFRQAQKHLPSECGQKYLEQLSKDAAGRWKEFVAALVECEKRIESDEAVEAATTLFDDAYLIFEKLTAQMDSAQP